MKSIAVAGHSDKESMAINSAYLDYVRESGFNPVLITKQSDLPTMVAFCDGLLLPGGVDIEPTFYREPNIASNYCSPAKDDFERKLMQMFSVGHKKIFGICRGFQLIVREFMRIHAAACDNHDFYQHVNEHNLASARSIARNVPTHSVRADMKALYDLNMQQQDIFVNSMHHQALACPDAKKMVIIVDAHNSLKPLAITTFSAPKYNSKEVTIIEAVDVVLGGSIMRGVQWHPEELMDTSLLTTFFDKAAIGKKQDNGTGQQQQR
ncbi:gamma-glutamyl-gamma-aminobutyrate hydrolase family protein [bacterium]|nr:gamma-glutamyl-gamma-aminobutyrate hydrolase family protein [bacterium]